MENNFTLPTPAEIVESGSMTFDFKVKGFWSSSVITLFVLTSGMSFKRYSSNDIDEIANGIDISISASSGGRDKKEIPEDEIAYANYANVLIQVNEFASKIRAMKRDIAVAYIKHREEMAALYMKENELKQAAIDNDSNIELDSIVKALKEMPIDGSLQYRERGTKNKCVIERISTRTYYSIKCGNTVGVTTMANKLENKIAEFI